jgi:hypothetical protein
MGWLIRWWVRGVMGLGAAMLLGAGVPAQARPTFTAAILAPAGATTWQQQNFTEPARLRFRGRFLAPGPPSDGHWCLMAQTTPPEKGAKTPEQRRLKKQLKRRTEPPAAPPAQQRRSMETGLERSAAPPREVPAKAGIQKFGAQPIRAKESPQGE